MTFRAWITYLGEVCVLSLLMAVLYAAAYMAGMP